MSNAEDEREALEAVVSAAVRKQNQAPLADFCGLSPAQMYALTWRPFDDISPVVWRDADAALEVPLYRALVMTLEYFAGARGAKLTPQGRLPRKLLRMLHELHCWDPVGLNEPPHLEEYLPVAVLLHALIVHEKLVRKRHNHYLLTPRGREWLADAAGNQTLWVMQASCQRYNWGYLDGYPELPEFQQGWGYLLWLVLQYGGEERPTSFYADKLLRAWPFLIEGLEADPWETPERMFAHIFELRGFQRWLAWLGFVRLARERRPDAEIMVRASPLLHQCWRARGAVAPVDGHITH